MTSTTVGRVLRRAVLLLACLGALGWARPATAQVTAGAVLRVQATFGTRVKVVFDRTTVSLDTQAYDPDTVTSISADPLTLSAKARVEPNTRVVLTLQAGSHLQSGGDTIPAQKLSWTIVGPGFHPSGSANPNAARMIGQWRGSGDWTGTQIYTFEDSWNYAVGTYSVVMTYTFSTP